MYKIYINDTSLTIRESLPTSPETYKQLDSQRFDFLAFYSDKRNRIEPVEYLLVTPRPKRLFKNVKKSMKLIKAAGGLVRNEENKYLFIFRKGKWDLPKGKLDEGEKTKKAAVREVEEECGIKVKSIGKKICRTWHVYEMGGKTILKRTAWYHMQAKGQERLVPQLEEDITEARWIAPGDFDMVRLNTYPLIKDVMSVAEC
ncbi:MAG: hypothetical protein K0S09_132 [Sphingobacteriaceae bacterium]|nr:hypothetical protein [Sphingobacteriaceae bacterium]